jgi:beta-mannosidase
MVSSITLDAEWTVQCTNPPAERSDLGDPVPAAVPGSVHTDLLSVGLIPDPFADDNEERLRWMFPLDWRYRNSVTIPPAQAGKRIDLVFDGIDTVATISLAGRTLGETRNMHRAYRFPVADLIDGEEQELLVDLASATRYAEAERERLGLRPSAYENTPFNYVRKMACSFGWDWGPDLRTAGLWKAVRIERWSVARLDVVRPLVAVDENGTGQVAVHVDLERADEERVLRVEAEVLGHRATAEVPAGQRSAVVTVTVPQAPQWWPVGYGEQPLADLTVLLQADGEALDSWTRRIGFRTVEVDTTPDEHGTPFVIRVNGRPIFIRGANWIPDDHFVTRLTRERLEQRLDQAVDAHVNLLRVWGGGIYESEEFYEACDARGVLVWQDFLLACAAYPEESPLWEEIEAEARHNVVRLMSHPSLVLWNGGNENLWGYCDWGWPQELDGRTWGERYARELLGAVVAELDPSRPYSDNSPYSPRAALDEVHPNDPDHGTHHQWDVWNRIDYAAYRSEIPRFCSEFGFQGPPAWRTLIDHVHAAGGGPLPEAPDPKNDRVFLLHQKAVDGNGKLDRGLSPHLGVPERFADWHWATQLNQARAVRYAIEHYRSWWPRTAGAIVWQLNDCWPVTSWAAIDSEARRKPLWYALRSAYAPHLLSVVERMGAPVVALVNDTDEVWSGELELTRETLGGEILAASTTTAAVAPRAVGLVHLDAALAQPTAPSDEVLTARLDGAECVHRYVEDVALNLEPRPFTADVRPVSGGYEVTIEASALVLDLMLLADRAAPDAVVDVGLITLRAGQRQRLQVTTAAPGLEQALLEPDTLRCANDLQAARRGAR